MKYTLTGFEVIIFGHRLCLCLLFKVLSNHCYRSDSLQRPLCSAGGTPREDMSPRFEGAALRRCGPTDLQ